MLPDALGAPQPCGCRSPVLCDLLLGGKFGTACEQLEPGLVALGDDRQPGGAVVAAPAASTCLTSRSSREWYDSTAIRPPTSSARTAAGIARSSTESSPLTSMRRAWKVRLAGLPPVRLAACGSASRISSTRRALVVNGSFSRSRTTAATILLACFSSP